MDFDPIFSKIDKNQEKWAKRRGKRKSYRRHPRPKRTREELLAFMRKSGCKSSWKWDKIRQQNDPMMNDYRKEFGNWSNAVREAFGKQVAPEINRAYVIKCVIEFNLWTARKYKEARRRRPDIFPTSEMIVKQFGSWVTFITEVKKELYRPAVNHYLALTRRYGRVPTIEECNDAGIEIIGALRMFGSKKALDDQINQVLKLLEKRDK